MNDQVPHILSYCCKNFGQENRTKRQECLEALEIEGRPGVFNSYLKKFFFLLVFLFEKERGERAWGRGRERGRERI